ncbi:Methionine synthase [subsurface metagenome]
MFEEISRAVIEGKDEECIKLTQKYLDEREKPVSIIKDGLVAGMNVVGKRFKAYEMYLPEVMMSANVMKKSMAILKPLISESEMPSMGKIIMATVRGDLHDIGKNLVSMMLEGAGFEIINLGVDVPVDRIIEEIEKSKAGVVGISALLTTSMMAMEPAIKKIKDKNNKVRVMVGGAPITQEFADKIGADGFAPDALRAIDLAKRLVST